MKVFEIVPADFFSVLVSPNREIYADALMKLYEMFQSEINIRLKAFLAEVELLLEDRQSAFSRAQARKNRLDRPRIPRRLLYGDHHSKHLRHHRDAYAQGADRRERRGV